MNARQIVAACLLVGSLWLALAGNAAAATGQIAYDGCLADDVSQSCFDLPFAPLNEPGGVAVSPDGKSVYVASNGGNSIAHFVRGGPDGQIAYDGCLANSSAQGCGDLPGDPLAGARGVAVSPDGKSVYVASYASDSIAHFFRNTVTGRIAWDGCLANDASRGCVDLPGAPLGAASGVAVSPDGKSVYVASEDSDSVAHFFRGTDSGKIAWDGCLANDGTQNCADLPGAPLDGAHRVAVSPDGKSVYVASFKSDSVAHLLRNGPDGQIAWDGCLNNDGTAYCADLPGAPLDGAYGVAVSPDGKSVYVASFNNSSIAHLFRNGPDGQIAWDGCLNNHGTDNCGDLPAAPLDGATAVTVSPDGKSVYVASQTGRSIAHLFRNGPDGQIAWDGCLNNDGTENCGDLPAAPLDGATAVAVSPDGKSVYVASRRSSSVAHFFRALDAAPPPRTPPAPGAPAPGSSSPADTLAPSISGLALTNRRFRVGRSATALAARRVPVGTTFRYTLSEPASVTVAVERARTGRRARGRCRKPGRPCGAGPAAPATCRPAGRSPARATPAPTGCPSAATSGAASCALGPTAPSSPHPTPPATAQAPPACASASPHECHIKGASHDGRSRPHRRGPLRDRINRGWERGTREGSQR